jgi:uncharacterized coiled-coil protein SlyX
VAGPSGTRRTPEPVDDLVLEGVIGTRSTVDGIEETVAVLKTAIESIDATLHRLVEKTAAMESRYAFFERVLERLQEVAAEAFGLVLVDDHEQPVAGNKLLGKKDPKGKGKEREE